MSEVILTVGISGSGKSTWVTEFLENNHRFLRINRDDIRKVLVADITNGYYKRKDLFIIENAVTDVETFIANRILLANKNVVVDNTNLTPKYIKRWIDWATSYQTPSTIKFKLFPIDLLVAKNRVAMRDFGWNASIPTIEVAGSVAYIDKQYDEYNKIVNYINDNYHSQIIL